MRTLLWFIGVAAVFMGIIGIIAQSFGLVYFLLIGMGIVALGIGVIAPEDM